MFYRYLSVATLALATSAVAQTFTDCDPTKKDCPPDPALGTSFTSDFTAGEDQTVFKKLPGTTLSYDKDLGAVFSISKDTEAPTIASHKYIFFGKLEVIARAAPGAGIVTSIVLQSDCLDEIDWEWVGNDPDRVQTNYFAKGDVSTYDRGAYHPVPKTTSEFHKYTLDWTAERIQWSVNDAVIRTVTPAESYGGQKYPETPMQIKLGTWVGGRKGASQGTIDWAGGLANFDAAPFLAYYKEITVTDYSTGAKQYIYGDRSGTWESIVVDKDGSGDDDSDKDDDDKSSTTKKPSSTKTSESEEPSSTKEPSTTRLPTSTPTTTVPESEMSTGRGRPTGTHVSPSQSTPAGDDDESPEPTTSTVPDDDEGAAPRVAVSGIALFGAAAFLANLLI